MYFYDLSLPLPPFVLFPPSFLISLSLSPQAMETLKKNPYDSDDDTILPTGKKILSANNPEPPVPDFRVTMERKYEMVALCQIFGNRWLKYIYLVVFSIICFVGMWAFSTVAGSAWASNIPYKFAGTVYERDNYVHAKYMYVEI